MEEISLAFLILSVLIIVSVLAGNFFLRLGVPTLLIGLVIGAIAKNIGIFNSTTIRPEIILLVGELALCIIIFSGGFETNPERLRNTFKEGITLSTLGLFTTIAVSGLLISVLLDLDLALAILLAAIISSTDAAAVFSIIDLNKKFSGDVDLVLQVESGSNDPLAYFIIISVVTYLTTPTTTILSMTLLLLTNIVVGVLSALILLQLLNFLYEQFPVKQGQSPILLLAGIFLLYSVNDLFGGSYFLSIYLYGLYFNRDRLPYPNSNLYFFESFSWLMETILFIILGYQVFLFELNKFLVIGIVVALILMFIGRPIGVMLSLLPYRRFKISEMGFISWIGLRGATPIVFALIPIVEGINNSDMIFDVAFIVVLISLIFQGISTTKSADIFGVFKEVQE